jgi:hypothetical protein
VTDLAGGFPYLAPRSSIDVAPGPRPSFSVIIPAYQAAAFVGDAVRSALEQTVAPLEVVVCDDGSTDDIDSALAPYRDRIVVVRQDNRGLPAAKNAAARAASGDFVAVLDADDLYLPQRIDALGWLAATRPDLDIVTTDVWIETPAGVVGRFTEQNAFVVDDQRSGLLRRSFIWSGAAIRREVLLANGGFDESVDCGEDWDCWRRLVFAGSSIGMVDVPLACYRIRPGSMTSSRVRDLRGRIDVLERALRAGDLSASERATALSTRRMVVASLDIAQMHEALRERAAGRRRAALAVALRPGRRSLSLRCKALGAAVAPGLAAGRLDDRPSDRRLEPGRRA